MKLLHFTLCTLLGLWMAAGQAASPTPFTPISPRPGVTLQVVNFPSDPPDHVRKFPGGGRILAPGLLYTPSAGGNPQGPAIVLLDQGPGVHPMEPGQITRFAAERLAAMGYTVLSLYSGLERGYSLTPFADSAYSIRGALDYLEASGHEQFVLGGQGYGAIAVANYMATQPDALLDNGGEKRVKAVLLLNPLTELRQYPRVDLLQRYEERVVQANKSMAAGRGGYPDLSPGHPPMGAYDPWLLAGPYVGPAISFLDFWGPQAAARNAELLRKLPVPTFVLAGDQDPSVSLAQLRELKTASTLLLKPYAGANAHFERFEARATQDMADWLMTQHLGPALRIRTQVLDIATDGGRRLQGMFYAPEKMKPGPMPALMLIGGRTADTVQSSTHWMGTRFAAKGYAVFAPGLRVAGGAGFQSSTHAEAARDIGLWIDRVAALGYRRIVLAGHSNGGIWLSNYISVSQDKRVVGTIYFAPTRDTARHAQELAGEAEYQRQLQTARDAVARGDGMFQVIGLMSAQAWLDNNGPDTRGLHTQRITEFTLPGLSITGEKDELMTPEFVAEFQRKYRGPLTQRRYANGSHGLRENKGRTADDVDAWMKATFR